MMSINRSGRDYRDLIFTIDSELSKIQDADILLERILLEARHVVNADAGTIYEKDGDQLVFKYSQNATIENRLPPGEKLPYSNQRIPIDESRVAGYSAKNMVVVRIDDAYAIPADRPYKFSPSFDKANDYKTTSILAVPLVASSGNLLGVIQVLNAVGKGGKVVPFTKDDEAIVGHFASSATNALLRAYMTRALVLRMIQTAELRDSHETAAHVYRVSGYAAEIYDRWAFRHGIGEKERDRTKDTLKMAAMLHDIGKVAISDLILKKAARFTPQEYQVMQAHTYCGARLFKNPESDFDRMAAEITLTHHENWDGSGYPGKVDYAKAKPEVRTIAVEGVSRDVEVWDAPSLEEEAEGRSRRLKGEEIPLAGRIVAVADVFDALVSKRVYKEAWTQDKVYDEIRAASGTKFDPEVVTAFFEILPRIEEIRASHPDVE
jgi:HD-GYP domain-containing protein (c-di-GMP phosphodiesterase class II)